MDVSPPLFKRGRGRPRKNPIPPTTTVHELPSAPNLREAVSNGTAGIPAAEANSARADSPIAAASAIEVDVTSISPADAMQVDTSAAQAFAPTHLRVVSANSVSPATFFSSSSTAQPSARKKTPANSRATTPNPIGTRSSPRKRKGGSVSQSASEASEAEENAEVDDSGQVSPRRLRSRATPESKNSSAKRPRINIEQSDSEPDTSAPASATSSKPAISLEPPVEEATESRSNGSTSPEVVTTRARTKRVSAEKPAAKKTTRGKYGQFKALPKSKKGKGKKKATVSSDDEHNSEEDGQGTRASSASSVQQSLGLKVPAVRALAKSRAGGSRNVSRETSPASSVGGRTARERKRAENEVTRARALATLAIEQDLLQSGEHPILVTLLARLAAEKEARLKSAQAYLARRLAEMDLLQAADERDVWVNWQEEKRELRVVPLRKVESAMRLAYHEFWDKPEDRIYLPWDRAPGPSPFDPALSREEPKHQTEERFQPTVAQRHQPDWQLADLEVQRDFKAMSFPPSFYPAHPTTDPLLLAPESSQLVSRPGAISTSPTTPRAGQAVSRQAEGPQLGGFTVRPSTQAAPNAPHPQVVPSRAEKKDPPVQARRAIEALPRSSNQPSSNHQRRLSEHTMRPQAPSRQSNQPSEAGEALLKRLGQSAASISSTPLPGQREARPAGSSSSDATPRTMPAQRSSRPAPFQMPATALLNVHSHAQPDSVVPRLHQHPSTVGGKA